METLFLTLAYLVLALPRLAVGVVGLVLGVRLRARSPWAGSLAGAGFLTGILLVFVDLGVHLRMMPRAGIAPADPVLAILQVASGLLGLASLALILAAVVVGRSVRAEVRP